MSRLRRAIHVIVFVSAIAITIAALGIWVRSYYVVDGIGWADIHGMARASQRVIGIASGKIFFTDFTMWSDAPAFAQDEHEWGFFHTPTDTTGGVPNDWHHFAGFYFRYSYDSGTASPNNPKSMQSASRQTDAGIPLSAVTLACLLTSFWSLRELRRPRPGHCRRCGYDLRATPDRCPECGEIAMMPKTLKP